MGPGILKGVGELGLYRGWNFRYERGDDGWTPSDYW